MTNPPALSDDTSFSIPDHVLSRDVGDELVLLNLASEKYFSLNASAVLVYRCLEKGRPLESCAAALQAAFQLDADAARSDTLAVVQQLLGRGLIDVA